MVNSVTELKDLIIWLKTQRVKSLTIGAISVEISDYAHIESLTDETAVKAPNSELTPASDTGLVDTPAADKAEDDEALFWSTR